MSEFRRRIMMGISVTPPLYPDNYVDDGYIWAYYNVTDIENPTTLLYGSLSSFGSDFIIDGQTVTAALTYQFQSTGEHIVKMTISGSLPGSSFRALSSLVRLYLPNTITSLGTYAIYDCNNLTHLWLSEEITTIGMYGVYGNEKLLQCNLYLPKLTTLSGSGHNGYNFRYSKLSRGVVNFPNLTSISHQGAFANTQIVEVRNLGSITSLPRTNGAGTFQEASMLKKVVLPETLETIGGYTFDGAAALTDVNLPTSIQTIGTYAFRNAKVTGTLRLPNLTSLGHGAFAYCRLTEIEDLGSITTLTQQSSTGAFRENITLRRVVLPATLTLIEQAFSGCTALGTIICYAVTPPVLRGTSATPALPGTSVVQHIYVPAEAVEDYKAASGWSSYASIIEAIPTT